MGLTDDPIDSTAEDGEPLKGKAADKILEEAREFFTRSMEADSWNRKEALDDIKFVENIDNYQWPTDSQRVRKGRPMLTENRCPQFTRRVVNNIRRNRPAISVTPASSDATQEIATVLEGMCRHVEQRSRADLAYDGGAESAVKCSIGYWRVITEYADDQSFDQELAIRPIPNALTVYDDPDCVMPDRSDRKKCIVSAKVPRKGFKEKYGVEPRGFTDTHAQGDDLDWFGEEEVRLAEYWRVTTTTARIYQAPDGTVLAEKDVPKDYRKQLKSREVDVQSVEMHLMTGDKIIESTKWLGCYIPIIAVIGEESDIEGKKYRKSLIRDAKDSQRSINYFASAEVEITSLTPKVPWLGPKGAFKTDEQKWNSMNQDNVSYVEYDGPIAPQRQFPNFFPDGIREAKLAAIESMKSIMGLHDASLGARSNETSGIAIENRSKEGDNATYHFVDNYIRAIRYGGLVIVDLLPKVYDAARVVRILKPDGTAEQEAINQVFVGKNGELAQIDISQGKYDVVVTAGSYQTQRQENRDSMIQLSKVIPQIGQVAPDLVVKNFDFAEVDELSKRLRATVPPQILGDEESPMPPEVQAAIQQVQQQQQEVAQIGQQVEQERAKVEADRAGVEAMKKELQAGEQLQAERGKVLDLQQQMREKDVLHAMEELAEETIAAIKEMLVPAPAVEQPAPVAPPGPSPELMAVLNHFEQHSSALMQALTAPRKRMYIKDDKGQTIGASDEMAMSPGGGE